MWPYDYYPLWVLVTWSVFTSIILASFPQSTKIIIRFFGLFMPCRVLQLCRQTVPTYCLPIVLPTNCKAITRVASTKVTVSYTSTADNGEKLHESIGSGATSSRILLVFPGQLLETRQTITYNYKQLGYSWLAGSVSRALIGKKYLFLIWN